MLSRSEATNSFEVMVHPSGASNSFFFGKAERKMTRKGSVKKFVAHMIFRVVPYQAIANYNGDLPKVILVYIQMINVNDKSPGRV